MVATLYSISHLTESQWSSFSVVGYDDMATLASNHASKCILDKLETFQVLSAETNQPRIWHSQVSIL